ncbi:MAG: tRNA pseudouridine synthase A [Ornithinimicrobium sp.]
MSDADDVVRLRMDLAYDGTHFSGWASQPGRRTVQETVESAWGLILRSKPPPLTVGGRTDAGVHARGSVAHVDLPVEAWESLPGRGTRSPSESALRRLAGTLPSDVVVHSVQVAPAGFDARFSALRRRYSYRLGDSLASLDPLRRHDTVRLKKPVEVARMNQAAAALLGLHDFAAYCRRREGATTRRTLLRFVFDREADGVVVGTLEADAFCRSMVRSLVGAVVPVGQGLRELEWPRTVLAGLARDPGVTVMPARGLCLEEIVYPPDAELAARAEQTRARRS